jgi:biopolymer transport protein ExbD
VKSITENGKYRIVAEINMIPLIDVSLVLLIIFMVMTPFLVQAHIKVQVPQAASAETSTKDNDSMRVQVDSAGKIYIDGAGVAAGQLETVLRRRVSDPAKQPVVIEADKSVQFDYVVAVLDACKKLGIVKIGIAVKPESRSGRP